MKSSKKEYIFVLSELRSEVIVHFVDISGIVDHYCLNFLFITGVFIQI